jgi:hypothetical protein
MQFPLVAKHVVLAYKKSSPIQNAKDLIRMGIRFSHRPPGL